jgi:hypothetical protein
MRLNLYWRGFDIVDVEVHLFRRRIDGDDVLITRTMLEDSERSDAIDPDTWVFGFAGGVVDGTSDGTDYSWN